MATLKNDLSLHNLTFEDAIEMALDKPLWGLLAVSGATHWWCMPNNDDDDDDIATLNDCCKKNELSPVALFNSDVQQAKPRDW